MSAGVKALENQTKHLTQAEIEAREEAEASCIPQRAAVNLDPPKGMKSGKAGAYWAEIVERLQGLDLLDDLDREMLMIYCQMLERRDKLQQLSKHLLNQAIKADGTNKNTEATDRLNDLNTKLNTLEKNIMSYADKLGFTPQSRVRLAQKRASAAAEDADADFFGD